MPSITSLVKQLASDLPALAFAPGGRFHWDPEQHTIYYPPRSTDAASLLHEVAHALLAHRGFSRDMELIEMERDAWEYAKTQLSATYGIDIDPDIVQDALDSYRDWLHARSTCPNCRATGIQIKQQVYRCLACASEWTVNDARQHALRRHIIKKHSH